MREDMFKVIVERPRRGRGGDRQIPIPHDLDEPPQREGLRARHRDRKWLNENLRPLQRWLASQVGRPWDKAFSELCAGIDRRSTVQQHIHQHIGDFVAVRVVVLDDRLCDAERPWRGGLDKPSAARYFVDPATGLLRENRLRARAHAAWQRQETEYRAAQTPNRRDRGIL